ncbi:hypothetical protein C8A00DRAFT_31502 [Chaetomidium leptoderma]|uniref:Uncharacterized protein n=1 Tax=Chaetomidium leptoderma TaxID=669021 RepID=A0AAN6VQV9_9PEZI|nr:hypothetical protein C8A00DRAFT_31502 [Chaetomidium leptoderma]
MTGGKFNSTRRAKCRAADAAKAVETEGAEAEQSANMDIDSEPQPANPQTGFLHTSAKIADAAGNGFTTAQNDGDRSTAIASLDMREVAKALKAAVDDSSDQNLNALLRAVDFDVVALANLAINNHNMPKALTILLSTAVMMSEDKATEAQKEALTAQSNCDGVFQLNSHNTHVLLAQGAHVSDLMRRVSALEDFPLASPSSSKGNAEGDRMAALEKMLVATNARLQRLEKQCDKYWAMAEKAMQDIDRPDDMNDLMGRMQVLADMRRKAEEKAFERRDHLRQQEMQKFRNDLASRRAMEKMRDATITDLQSNFRKMRTYFIASMSGDLTIEELKERFSQLLLHGSNAPQEGSST